MKSEMSAEERFLRMGMLWPFMMIPMRWSSWKSKRERLQNKRIPTWWQRIIIQTVLSMLCKAVQLARAVHYVTLEGLEHLEGLPPYGVLVCSTHTGNREVPVFIEMFTRGHRMDNLPCNMPKQGILDRIPLLEKAHCLPMRTGMFKDYRAMEQVAEYLTYVWAIMFPEGTRIANTLRRGEPVFYTDDMHFPVRKFMRGAAWVVMETDPIVLPALVLPPSGPEWVRRVIPGWLMPIKIRFGPPGRVGFVKQQEYTPREKREMLHTITKELEKRVAALA